MGSVWVIINSLPRYRLTPEQTDPIIADPCRCATHPSTAPNMVFCGIHILIMRPYRGLLHTYIRDDFNGPFKHLGSLPVIALCDLMEFIWILSIDWLAYLYLGGWYSCIEVYQGPEALILGHLGLALDDLVLTRLFGAFHDLYVYDKILAPLIEARSKDDFFFI